MITRTWLLTLTAIWTTVLSFESHQKVAKICSVQLESPKCEGKLRGEKLSCSGGFTPLNTKELHRAKSLSLCNWSDDFFSPQNVLDMFPNLLRLAVRQGNVSILTDDFPFCHLEVVIFTDLPLEFIKPSTFSRLFHLKSLDLSRNQLQELDPGLIFVLPEAAKVYVTGNPWRCSSNLSWVLDNKVINKIMDIDKMACGSPYAGKPITRVLNLLQKMESECPWSACNCSMPHIVWDTDEQLLHPVIAVNCTHGNLQEMPMKLPRNTTTLYLSYNAISDLSPLMKNPTYFHILDVYLDHNRISNLDALEGSDWLKNFRVLSLKANHLTQVPTYALDHAFERNVNLGRVYLGENPWICDCDFTPAFQHLLIKYESIVRDLHEIKCVESDQSEHSLMPVVELSIGSICYVEPSINPLDIVSGILAFLIILVIGKLIFDYWNFKRTGRLPWIVVKMP